MTNNRNRDAPLALLPSAVHGDVAADRNGGTSHVSESTSGPSPTAPRPGRCRHGHGVRTAAVAAARAGGGCPRHALAVSGCDCPDGCGSCPDSAAISTLHHELRPPSDAVRTASVQPRTLPQPCGCPLLQELVASPASAGRMQPAPPGPADLAGQPSADLLTHIGHAGRSKAIASSPVSSPSRRPVRSPASPGFDHRASGRRRVHAEAGPGAMRQTRSSMVRSATNTKSCGVRSGWPAGPRQSAVISDR